MKVISRFHPNMGGGLPDLEMSGDGTIHLSVSNQRRDDPLSDYCKGDSMLTLRCVDCVDSGKCCNVDSLTGMCPFESGLHNVLIGVALGKLHFHICQ